MKRSITTPLTETNVKELNAGDEVLISGTIFTARDAAHKRLTALIDSNQKLPVDLKDQILYYTGPTPAQPGKVIGSAGPTTSSRMDRYTPKLIHTTRLRGIIGKGNRSPDVIKSFIDYGCIYFAAIGGAGALLSKCITESEIVCYEDLGAEAIYKLTVKDFPVIVAIDSRGKNLYRPHPIVPSPST
jgi:fumarate hydratase subunit beta